jgi:hypothetical protein
VVVLIIYKILFFTQEYKLDLSKQNGMLCIRGTLRRIIRL